MESLKASVVDECYSTMDCDPDHDYQPPCPHNIVYAYPAVWKALGVKESDGGEIQIFWSDAWLNTTMLWYKYDYMSEGL